MTGYSDTGRVSPVPQPSSTTSLASGLGVILAAKSFSITEEIPMSKILAVLAAIASVVSLYAVDGQVLINQSTLNAAGGTFPITQPGSYKLSGNLIAKDQNTHVIVISADHVTIDLNGFAILGTADCSGGLVPCAGSGSGQGIRTITGPPRFNITIRNGTIQGMGDAGISLFGDSNLIEHMHIRSNGGGGILVFSSNDDGGSIVQYNTVERNGGSAVGGAPGILVGRGSVHHNTVNVNWLGISSGGGSLSENVITRNFVRGISVTGSVSYKGNVLQGNSENVNGGFNQGQNLCDNAACPGAVF
jgi:hypothetical protein